MTTPGQRMTGGDGVGVAGDRSSALWRLDPDWITINHGSFGATPVPVEADAARWRTRVARQPTRFFHAEWPGLIRDRAARLAARLGCDADAIALVGNATEGVGAVLRSRRFAANTAILLLDQGYGAVRQAARFVAREHGATLVFVTVPFPEPDPGALLDRLDAALARHPVALAVLDHILSPSGAVLPIADMVARCRARSVPVLVDGAHAPGQVAVAPGRIGADWYVGNLHKWWFAPPAVGFLHSTAAARHDLHPLAVSHALDGGFAAEFDWTGTRDPVPWLVADGAASLHDRLGGPALARRNAALARDGARIIARRLGTAVAPAWPGNDGGTGNDDCGAMAMARLPDRAGPATPDAALAWRERLMGARLDAPVVALGGALWVRCSAQLYNVTGDYARAATIVADLLGS